MKKYGYLILGSLFLLSCDSTTSVINESAEINILPSPKELINGEKTLVLSGESTCYAEDASLAPLLDLFSEEIESISGLKIPVSNENDDKADIQFEITTALSPSQYEISIDKIVAVKAGSFNALLQAKNTLLQLVENIDGQLTFPILSIKDSPDASYRGLMIDVARRWHSVETLEKLINLAAFYKIDKLQLHFTDYQLYTLPSKAFPKLSTPDKHYSFDDLTALENYATERGVTIIPEIDIPGHSSPFVEKYPEIFGIKDRAINPWIINMGNEEAYNALDQIIGEIAAIFKSSPYFHIGGDEAIFDKVIDDPKVKEYMISRELGDDVHELYRHFIVRMNEIVKKHGKQMCVWEGFAREGKVKIPKDILVYEFETNRYLPNHLIEDGYSVINTSWKPLYVVNKKKWSPKTIYNWNLWRWENWFDKAPSIIPIQLEKTELIKGAQMCSWEQSEEVEIPSLRKRLPAFSERIWNTTEQISYDEMMHRMDCLDDKLSKLINDNRQDSLLIGHDFSAEMLK